jgi:MoaA/NifB/PqqE/SkfB family radical SAM enzyme
MFLFKQMTCKIRMYPIAEGKIIYIFLHNSFRSKTEHMVKQINAAGAGLSYLSGILTRKPVIAGMPLSAGIEITNHCNLKCPGCYSGSGQMRRAKGFMKEELFDKFISEAGPYLQNINLYFQGESMLHPGFFNFIEKCDKLRLTISTNGHFLSEENSYILARSVTGKLIVSLDGMDNETYSKYRINGNLEKVIAGIRNISGALSKVRSRLKLEIQFLVNRYNEHQITLAKKFAGEVHSTLKLKSMQILDLRDIEKWLPSGNRYRRYRKDKNGHYRINSSLRNNCLRLWMNPVVTWDGKVIPCCFDKNAEHVMGDLNVLSFREIWHGEKFRSFRAAVLKERKGIDICCNCTSGLRKSL